MYLQIKIDSIERLRSHLLAQKKIFQRDSHVTLMMWKFEIRGAKIEIKFQLSHFVLSYL